MLNLLPLALLPRKAGAKLLLFYETTKFLSFFYYIIIEKSLQSAYKRLVFWVFG